MTRRDLLKLAGGTALGLACSPVPWKLLDDTAIWTQNWERIPKLSRLPLSYRWSACTLCPTGCAVRARCVGELPVGLQGVAEHGAAQGVLCPIGLAGHHVAFNPWRLHAPVAFTSRDLDASYATTTAGDAARRIAHALRSRAPGERLAVLDARPGRVLSLRYRQFLNRMGEASYLTPHGGDAYTARLIASILGLDPTAIGFDLRRADLIVSVGVPLFDSWGTPERMAGLLHRNGPRVIQIEGRYSRTAARADRWLPVRPGSEAALGLGIARIVLREHPRSVRIREQARDFQSFADLAACVSLEHASRQTGLPIAAIEETARALCGANHPLILAGCDPAGGPLQREAAQVFGALDVLLGNPAAGGSAVVRRHLPDEHPETTSTLVDLPDHSVAVLLLDSADDGYALPWELIERKLVPERALVVSLSPYFGGAASRADLIVPSPAHFESMEELTQAADSPVRCFGISPPLLPVRPGSTRPIEFLRMIECELTGTPADSFPYEAMMEERARAIHRTGRGTLLEFSRGRRTPVTQIDAHTFWAGLAAGGRWSDDSPAKPPRSPVRLLAGCSPERVLAVALEQRPEPDRVRLMPTGLRGALTPGATALVLSKLFQESDLRDRTGRILLNGATARRLGLGAGERVRVRTEAGAMTATVRLDETVADGAAVLPVGPSLEIGPGIERGREEDVLSLCTIHHDGSWNNTTAWIEHA